MAGKTNRRLLRDLGKLVQCFKRRENRAKNYLENRWAVIRSLVLVCILGSPPAAAQVVWEDYQGIKAVTGSSNQDLAGPAYDNNTGSTAATLANLRAISSSVSNAVRTGTSAQINYAASSVTLCDIFTGDPAGTGAACQADAMGRVMYAVIRFPLAGAYNFSISHDDQVDLDMSTNWSQAPQYRTLSYDIPVGSLPAFTSETTFDPVNAGVSAPSAGSCAVLRLYWNNSGGINHLRLRWSRPDAVTEIIPAANLLDPRTVPTSALCSSTITSVARSIQVNKFIDVTGRADPADQFVVGFSNSGVVEQNATTTGNGTGVQASTAAGIVLPNTTYTITDAMAAGSASTLASYRATIVCTSNGAPIAVGGSSANWTVTTTSDVQQIIVCTVTNSRRLADLRVTKTNTPGINGEADQAADVLISGTSTSYTITVTNLGPDGADGVRVRDQPTNVACATASCSASAGASCPPQSGAALMSLLLAGSATIPILPNGGSVTFTIACQVL